jgi:hypothetical protein
MVFGVVSIALIWKRVYDPDTPVKQQMFPIGLITLLTLASVGECGFDVGRLATDDLTGGCVARRDERALPPVNLTTALVLPCPACTQPLPAFTRW